MVKHRMYKILEAKELTTNIYLMVVEAPRVDSAHDLRL